MPKNEKLYPIYLKAIKRTVYVTKKEFDDYYREINAYRRTQQNHGRCVCPRTKWLQCDMNCGTCLYQAEGDTASLDDNPVDDKGREIPRLDLIRSEKSTEEIVLKKIEMTEILNKIKELMPQALEIGELRLQDFSEDKIAEIIKKGRKTYAYQIKKVKEKLKKEYPDFFE